CVQVAYGRNLYW
nr:immunoglobulin heavy chain junction region [Macaca mulatta]MOY27518.1 immunoglobulin heavy chain junction region [Macaca mulatta]